MKQWIGVCVGLWAAVAVGNERRFTQSYETSVLPPGAKELELSEAVKVGKDQAYLGLEHRFELEMGVVRNLQTSIYVNLTSELLDNAPAKDSTESWSVSNEWKLKLLDAVADPVGLGLYGEITAGYREIELEAKLLLDKRMGPFHAVFNLVGEHEWEMTTGAPNRDDTLEGTAGLVYFFNRQISAGVESVGHSIFSSDAGYEGTAFYLGPTVTWASERFWVTASFSPQIAGIQADETPPGVSGLELSNHTRFDGRLLMGFSL